MGEVIAAALLTLGGVVVGSFLNVWVDRARFRRDWLVSQINRRLDHYGDLLDALYAQHVLLNKAAAGVVIPDADVDRAIAAWRVQLSRSVIRATAPVQHAVAGYDQAQAATAQAVATNDRAAVEAALPALDAARLAVLAAIETDQHDINDALSNYVLSPWRRLAGDQPWRDTQ